MYRDTLVPSYFLVRYAGTCMFAWLEWGRWPGARFPLPKTWGFLVFGQLQRRQPASLPLPSVSQSVPTLAGKPWGLRLFRYGETNPVHSSISSYRHYRHTISPKAEPFWGIGNRQSLDLSEIFPGCLGVSVWILHHDCLL